MNSHQKAPSDCADFPEAAIAGTLALMTCHVQCVEAKSRDELAQHVLNNLSKLSCHPQISVNFKSMLLGLHMRWQIQLQNQAERSQFAPPPHGDTRTWLPTPNSVQ
jgi:hypothetical protein